MDRLSILLAAIAAHLITIVSGHGMVLDPIARGSRWRCNTRAPRNYDDNGLFCGGYNAQWGLNNGKCGLCGDNYADRTPRSHELGGVFGQGEIVGLYSKGDVISVSVLITANHRGHFLFNLCDISGNGNENEGCFQQYPVLDSDGRRKWYLNSTANGEYNVKLQLPANLVCEHCVLQWTYVAGNNWGYCEDGSGRLGCGPQEHFRTCSDISILERNDARMTNPLQYCSTGPRSLNWIFDNIPENR